MPEANAAKQRTQEATTKPVREDSQDYVDTVKAAEEVQNDISSTLQEKEHHLRAVEQITRVKSVVKSGVEGEDVSRRENTLRRAGEAEEVRESGWKHIGRVPGAPDPALTESNTSSRGPLQLPTEVCERIIDWLWGDPWMLRECAVVCKAWTPRCRYQMQRHVVMCDRSHVQGHARRARAQPHLLQQAKSVWVMGGAKQGEQGPIPQLGTLAMMGAGKLPLVWRLGIVAAIWKPSDFHPLIFVHLSAFSSVTALRLLDVTFPKVREFGRLVCALPSLVRLRCANALFANTAPCASLAITRFPPSVKLTDLMIFSNNETSSSVEANRALIEHLCAAGVVADLQRFEISAWASSDSKYLEDYRGPLHELRTECSRSLRNLKPSPYLHRGKDLQTDEVSNTITSVSNIAHCDSLESVNLHALNFGEVGYAWMLCVLKSSVSKKLREVSIVIDRPRYSLAAEEILLETVSALNRDICPHLDELFAHKDYEKLCHADFTFQTNIDEAIPDATRWASLLEAKMPKMHERGVLRTRVDVSSNSSMRT